MKRFEYHEPGSLEEASALLAELGKASLLAGGTDLLVEIKEELRHVDHVVNIKKIAGLDTLSYDPKHGLTIGALVTARRVETHPDVIKHYPNLVTAVQLLGSIQVRNRATVVGNICRASPSADTIPPLMSDAAELSVVGPAGERRIAIEAFFTGPGRTVLGRGEIVTAIRVPAPGAGSGRAYIKYGRRKAMELATVGVAVSLASDGGRCSDVRIALGAVGPTAIRALRAEDLLRGREITEAAVQEVALRAREESTPITNLRASADYRRDMVQVLTRRAIGLALEGRS